MSWWGPEHEVRRAIEDQTRAIEQANRDAWLRTWSTNETIRSAAGGGGTTSDAGGAFGCLAILAVFGGICWGLYQWFPTFVMKTLLPVSVSLVVLVVAGWLAFVVIGFALSLVWAVLEPIWKFIRGKP